MGKRPGLDNRL